MKRLLFKKKQKNIDIEKVLDGTINPEEFMGTIFGKSYKPVLGINKKDKKRKISKKHMHLISLVDDWCSKLSKCGLERFLKKDFQTNVFLGFGYFNFDYETKNNLMKFFDEVIKYLELPSGIIFEIDFYEELNNDIVVEFDFDRYIRIKAKRTFLAISLDTTICQICTRYFLEYHKLTRAFDEYDMKYIDVMAILLGFRKYVKGFGHYEINFGDERDFVRQQYINGKECKLIESYLLEKRKFL